MRDPRVMLTLFLSAVLAGCGGDRSASSESPLTAAEFVDVVVEIREAEREVVSEDSAAQLFDLRKREVLDRHGTTEAELRAFVTAHAGNLALLEQVWDTIAARLTIAPPSIDAGGIDAGGVDAGSEEEEVGEDEVDDGPPGPPRRLIPPSRDGERFHVIQ